MKTDPHRVARILKDGFAIWKAQHRDGRKYAVQLSHFCLVNDLPYKLVSKWMSKGLRYVHPDSEGELRRLCAVLNVKYEDLWEAPTVSLSAEDVAEAIRLLSELQAVLQKSLDGVRPKRKQSRAKPILDQLASGSISVEEAQRLLDEAKADKRQT